MYVVELISFVVYSVATLPMLKLDYYNDFFSYLEACQMSVIYQTCNSYLLSIMNFDVQLFCIQKLANACPKSKKC